MYEVGPRPFRRSMSRVRILVGACAVSAVAVGFLMALMGPELQAEGLVVVVLGVAGLFAGVVFPVIRDVEIGFPAGIGVRAALRERDEEILVAFTAQEDDFAVYAQLLCGDPAVATALLEAAWANAAARWRGPVTPDIRARVLGALVHLLESYEHRTGSAGALVSASAFGPRSLAGLPLGQRSAVVLHEFAGLPLALVARMTGRRLADVADDLDAAEFVVGGRSVEDPP